jgi:cysteine desulfurase
MRRAGERLTEESRRLEALRDELVDGVLREIPSSHLNGKGADRTPNTANLRFDGVDGEELVKRLDREGFALSTGAACSAGAVAPSHVLIAMGLAPREVQGSLRVSLGRTTQAGDVCAFAAALQKTVQNVRATTENAVSQVRVSR